MRQGIAVLACALALAGCATPSERTATPGIAPVNAAAQQPDTTMAPPAAGEAQLTAGNADGQGDVRCVETAITGSRIPRRICLTEAEWERWRMDSQELVREWQGPKTGAR